MIEPVEVSKHIDCTARPVRSWGSIWPPLLLLLLYFSITVLLQWASGTYHSDFGGYPDEPGHYVTGLMVRDYIAAGFPDSPFRFAENYYLHYPKVAIGHWPPVFYSIQAAWMLIFRLPALLCCF